MDLTEPTLQSETEKGLKSWIKLCPRREIQQNDNGETNKKAVWDGESWTRAYF